MISAPLFDELSFKIGFRFTTNHFFPGFVLPIKI